MNSVYERIDIYRKYKSWVPGLDHIDEIPTFYKYLYFIIFLLFSFESVLIIPYQIITIALNNFILNSKLLITNVLACYLLGILWSTALITKFHYKKLSSLVDIKSTVFNNDHLSKLLARYKFYFIIFLILALVDFLFKIIYKYSNAGILSYQVGIGIFLVQIILLVFYIAIIYILYQIYQD